MKKTIALQYSKATNHVCEAGGVSKQKQCLLYTENAS